MISIGGGGGSKSKSKIKDVTPVEFAGLRPEVATALEQLIATGGAAFGQQPSATGAPTPTAPMVAPITATEQDLLRVLQAGASGSPAQQAGTELLTQTIQGQFLDPASNPFLQAAIQAQQQRLAENFRLIEAPLLQSRFTRAGQSIQPQGSSAFDTAAAIALRGLTQSQADIATQLTAANFAQERDRQMQAVQQAQAISSDETQRVIQVLQAQALPRLIEQLGIDRGLEEFRRRMEVLLAALGIGAQVTQPSVAGTSQSKTSPEWKLGLSFGGS